MIWLCLVELSVWVLFFNPVQSQQARCDSTEEFQCQQTRLCIDKKLVCDGTKDCAGGSDETQNLCLYRSCSRRLDSAFDFRLIDIAEASNSFRCDYGACIAKYFVCNGLVNCVDESDESPKHCKNMVCKDSQFKCDYGACIGKSSTCNGKRDCRDGSDETEKLCKTRKTSCFRQFRCSYGACIKKRLVCNGRVDCFDESDEQPSVCGKYHTYKRLNKYVPLISFPVNTEMALTTPTTREVTTQKFKDILDIFSSIISNPDDLQKLSPLFPSAITTMKSTSSVDNERKPKNIGFCNIQGVDANALNILSCGSSRSAKAGKCVMNGKVPSSTVILSECWETTSVILACRADGLWLPIYEEDSRKAMDVLCQPSRLYSKICGRFPYLKQYRRSQTKQNQVYKWPFLAGIFETIKFICTGTIITNSWILTAAHCFPHYRKDEFDVSDFRIQLSSSIGQEDMNTLSVICVHPNYGREGHFQNDDIALIKLSEQLFFSKSLFPACIDDTGEDVIERFAATFIRKEGENEFNWDLTRQKLDVSCFNTESHCSRHLTVGRTQFCGANSDDPVELKPKVDGDLEPGSSGGPFLVNKAGDNDDQWTVAGVVSYQVNTNGCPSYTVFSSLRQHRYWIEDCVKNGFCAKLVLQ